MEKYTQNIVLIIPTTTPTETNQPQFSLPVDGMNVCVYVSIWIVF